MNCTKLIRRKERIFTVSASHFLIFLIVIHGELAVVGFVFLMLILKCFLFLAIAHTVVSNVELVVAGLFSHIQICKCFLFSAISHIVTHIQ